METTAAVRLQERLNGRVVFLEPVQNYPQNAGGNPLVSVLTRLMDAGADWQLFPADASTESAPFSAGVWRQGRLEIGPGICFQQLRLAITNAAISYPGNLPARAGHLDPDSFAAEVLRREWAYAHLRETVGQAFTSFCELARVRHPRTPDLVFGLVFLDADIYWQDQRVFLKAVWPFLPESVEIFIVNDENSAADEMFVKSFTKHVMDRVHVLTLPQWQKTYATANVNRNF